MRSVIYQLDDSDIRFPDANLAIDDPDGLLAIGGDLRPERLVSAYRSGIFPWFNHQEPYAWWSPSMRGVLFFDDFVINRSFRKFLNKHPYRLSVNTAFEQVIRYCASVPRQGQGGTWITQEMMAAYTTLHQQGHAHSIEVWDEQTLVGGLYGVIVGNLFCGESMFHLKPYCSKLAYHTLVELLKSHGGEFIDCQMQNDFLVTLGVSEISRELYLEKLASALNRDFYPHTWRPRFLTD